MLTLHTLSGKQWYSDKIVEELDSGKSVDEVHVGLQMFVVKPLSGNWF